MSRPFAVPPGIAPAWDAVALRNGVVVHASRGEPAGGAATGGGGAGGTPLLFDVASLTKPLVTGTLAALFVKEGRIALDAPAADWLPAFRGGGKERVTVRQLLAHSSGLPWWRPWFERARVDPVAGQAFLPPAERPADLGAAFARGREILVEGLTEESLEAEPGTRALYSDPGFLALGFVLEAAGGAPLDRLFAERVAAPMALGDTFFVGPAAALRTHRAVRAPTRAEPGDRERRQRLGHGGVAGHAGLFSTAGNVARLGQEWLLAMEGHGRILDCPPGPGVRPARHDAGERAGARVGYPQREGVLDRRRRWDAGPLARSATWATRGAPSGSTGTARWCACCSPTTSRRGTAPGGDPGAPAVVSRHGGHGDGVSGMAEQGRGRGQARRWTGRRSGGCISSAWPGPGWAPSRGCSRRPATRSPAPTRTSIRPCRPSSSTGASRRCRATGPRTWTGPGPTWWWWATSYAP